MMAAMELSEFLLARIAEDESAARRVLDQEPWQTGRYRGSAEFDAAVYVDAPIAAVVDDETARHIARHDPARVLAECEGKRRIVGEHPSEHAGTPFEAYNCRTCVNPEERDGYPDEWTAASWPCGTLRSLALPYAAHPDYRQEWRP